MPMTTWRPWRAAGSSLRFIDTARTVTSLEPREAPMSGSLRAAAAAALVVIPFAGAPAFAQVQPAPQPPAAAPSVAAAVATAEPSGEPFTLTFFNRPIVV